MRIGNLSLSNQLVVAPMAGVTDRPFRALCRRLGAGLAVSEMVSADPRLRHTRKSRTRIDHAGEPGPVAVQIAGAHPQWMADAARYNVDRGADLIDINMGCPAKKVCNRAAGSALLSDATLVEEIVDAVVKSVAVPVTLKIRTGPTPHDRNALCIANIAQRCGVAALAIHGRTRACAFKGYAEHDTARAVKQSVSIPVLANGDVATPQAARAVLEYTQADGLLIGRGAQGNPWIFREVAHYLRTGSVLAPPSPVEVREVMLDHLRALYALYGERQGVRIARKHLSWYCKGRPGAGVFWKRVNRIESARDQIATVSAFVGGLVETARLRHDEPRLESWQHVA